MIHGEESRMVKGKLGSTDTSKHDGKLVYFGFSIPDGWFYFRNKYWWYFQAYQKSHFWQSSERQPLGTIFFFGFFLYFSSGILPYHFWSLANRPSTIEKCLFSSIFQIWFFRFSRSLNSLFCSHLLMGLSQGVLLAHEYP